MKNNVDTQYLDLVRHILENGVSKPDRTGTGTKSVFGYGMKFDVSKHTFPIVTCKKTLFRSVLHELIWFLSGDTNIEYLVENGVGIWNDWADENGELGPVYGKQWRDWDGVDGSSHDQIKNVIENLKTNPDSRRHIVSAWNVGQLHNMALYPCHFNFQLYSRPLENGKRELDMQLGIRSNDVFLGCPFNISSYALLLIMLAQITNHVPGTLHYVVGDAHIYTNHFDACQRLLDDPVSYPLPSLEIDETIQDIDDFTAHDIELHNYQSGPWIKAPIAV